MPPALVFVVSVMMLPSFNSANLTVPPIQIEDAPQTKAEIISFVRRVQHEFGLGDDFYKTLRYESWNWRNEQSHVPNRKGPNGRENSWGVCQIHLTAHPNITMEQAMSPAWCIYWSAKEFKEGRASQWTGWNLLQQGKI